jgi:hypothetical protein
MSEEISAGGNRDDRRFYERRSAGLLLLHSYLDTTPRPAEFVRMFFRVPLARLAQALNVNFVPLEVPERILPDLARHVRAENTEPD